MKNKNFTQELWVGGENNLSSFRLFSILLISAQFIIGCSKEDIILNSKTNELKIKNVEVINGKFSFFDLKEFNEVKADFYKNQADYKKYLFDIDFPCYQNQKEKLKIHLEREMSDLEVLKSIKDFKLTLNSDNELTLPYKLAINNSLFNLDGQIMIDGKVISAKETNSIKSSSQILEQRAQSANCATYTEWDGGWRCADRRLKLEVHTSPDSYADGGTPPFVSCSVTYECEAKTTLFKQVGPAWIHKDADWLEVSSTHTIFSERTINRVEATESGSATSTNEDEVIICFYVTASDDVGTCANYYNSNHGIVNSYANGSGFESGGCGSKNTKYLAIDNCN